MEGFGAAALRLAGAAGLLLGWRPPDFWSATPAELATAAAALLPRDGPVASSSDINRLLEMFPDG